MFDGERTNLFDKESLGLPSTATDRLKNQK